MKKNKRIFFSVIIPTYNRAEQVVQAISSVLQQTHDRFEVIVVDDGSSDATRERVANMDDPRIHYYWKENAERGAARNFGIQKAKGGYITFLDSDDRLYPSHLSEAYKTIENLKNPGVFHLGYDKKLPDGHTIEVVKNLPSIIEKLFIKGNPLSCNGVFLRSDIAKKYQFVEDRQIAGSEDWVLWVQLAARFNFHHIKTITSSIIEHDARSVLQVEESSLAKRKLKAIEHAFQDKAVQNKFGHYKKQIQAHAFTYIALHLALAGQPAKAFKYIRKASITYLPSLFGRRGLAIVKHSLRALLKSKK